MELKEPYQQVYDEGRRQAQEQVCEHLGIKKIPYRKGESWCFAYEWDGLKYDGLDVVLKTIANRLAV
jgi:hypothetical protein